jgi:5'-3' exonuclease
MTATVIIDSSYYNFYRFFATVSWYNYSPERREAAENVAWLENPTFMKTFEKMWFENIKKICKKFSVTESDLVFARDGSQVWRYAVYPEYKANRAGSDTTDPHAPGPVFKWVNEHYHSKLASKVIRVETAEADDIIAVLTKVWSDRDLVVITGDHDLLQLSSNRVRIFQLKGWKEITATEPRKSILLKILAGDASDNIPPVFVGCGKKTAERLIALPEPDFLAALEKKNALEQYRFNCTLIEFTQIPDTVVAEIKKQV